MRSIAIDKKWTKMSPKNGCYGFSCDMLRRLCNAGIVPVHLRNKFHFSDVHGSNNVTSPVQS